MTRWCSTSTGEPRPCCVARTTSPSCPARLICSRSRAPSTLPPRWPGTGSSATWPAGATPWPEPRAHARPVRASMMTASRLQADRRMRTQPQRLVGYTGTEAFPITVSARLRSPGLPAGRQGDMLDHGIRGREERDLVPVAPPHQVRRAAILASHLGDHSPAVGVTDVKSLDDQFVADLCFHDWLPLPQVTRHC